MKNKIVVFLVSLLFVSLTLPLMQVELMSSTPAEVRGAVDKGIPLSLAQEPTPIVYVDPPEVDNLFSPANFTISVKVANVTDLYGIDLQFGWNPSIIQYASHVKKIPVNSNPGGIMYSPTIPIKDQVDETASMAGSEPGTMYWVAEASMLPAASFNGSGTVFEMTFRVVANGTSSLNIIAVTLSDKAGFPIDRTVVNGKFVNFVQNLGTINGTVTDSFTNLPIDGATVTADSVYNITDLSGHYQITLNPGIYMVTASKSGYANDTKPANITAGVITTVNFTLVPLTPDFSISASPDSLTMIQGASGNSTINVTSLNGLNETVDLSVTGTPENVTASLSPESITISSGGTASSTLMISAGPSAIPGTYALIITGTSEALTHNTTVTLILTISADFSIAASPSALVVARGDADASTLTVTSLNGFSSEVNLSIFDLPAGVVAFFNSSTVTPPPDGSATSTLILNVSNSTAPGNYSLTISGTSDSLTHSVTISLIVTAQADFTVSASPSSLTAAQGGGNTSIITVTSIYGFNAAVNLSVSGAPTGVTVMLNPMSVTPFEGSATSTLTVSVNATATAGSYDLIVTGISGSLTHNTTVTLIVKGVQVIEACVEFKPEALNLKCKGKWIICFIKLPKGYNASDIDASTIMLNGTVSASKTKILWDCDHDRVIGLLAKFNRTEVQQFILNAINATGKEARVRLTVTGSLKDGTQFQGTDRIKVIRLPHHHHHHHR